MILNTIVLIIIALATYLVVRVELTDIRKWLYQNRTQQKEWILKMVDFWVAVVKNPARAMLLFVILVFQRGLIGMAIAIILLLLMSYYFAKSGVLGKITWNETTTQGTATAIMVFLALFWVLSRVGVGGLIYYIILIGVGILAVLGVVFIVFSRKK